MFSSLGVMFEFLTYLHTLIAVEYQFCPASTTKVGSIREIELCAFRALFFYCAIKPRPT